MTKKELFRKDLEELINKYSIDSASNTPDYVLASYIDSINWRD